MADPVVTLNGIQLNPPLADGTGYELDEDGLTGWYGSPKLKATYTSRPAGTGSFYSPLAYPDARIIGITGELVAASSVAFLLAQRTLAAICSDPAALYTLQVTDDAGTLTAQVQRSGEMLVKPLSSIATAFSLSLTAPDPYKYDPNAITASTPLASSASGLDFITGGGLDFVTGGGLNFGTSTSTGAFTLANPGTGTTWPTFTFVGPLTNPTITNTATGAQLAYTGTLGGSDSVVVTTSPFARSVILNGGTDRWPYLTTAQWSAVPAAGAVTFQLTSTNPADTGSLVGSINPAYW